MQLLNKTDYAVETSQASRHVDMFVRPFQGPYANPLADDRFWMFAKLSLGLALFTHACFILLFVLLGSTTLSLINVGSVLCYSVCIALARQRRYGIMMTLVWFELLTHATIATAIMGWESGFHYYALFLVTVTFVGTRTRKQTMIARAAALICLYVGLSAWAESNPAFGEVSKSTAYALRLFNMVVSLGGLAFLSYYYAETVRRVENELHALATTDTLTGLNNRRRLLEIADYELLRTGRSNSPLSVIMCDIDHFKHINDKFGHASGDQVLVQVTGLMQKSIRQQDTLCRWGGEEFVILLPETAMQEAVSIAERMRLSIAEVGDTPQALTPVTITLGVAQWRSSETIQECIDRADEAMYIGKRAGRNRTVPESIL